MKTLKFNPPDKGADSMAETRASKMILKYKFVAGFTINKMHSDDAWTLVATRNSLPLTWMIVTSFLENSLTSPGFLLY